jgi:hypothetical protein
MNNSRLYYRSRQFWQAISTRSSQEDITLASDLLAPAQFELFQQMQKSEQAHSLRVLKGLRKQGENNIDLQTAALLHDVGKVRVPLHVWERALVVIVRALCPDCVHLWGSVPTENNLEGLGWRRAFVVADQHPAWGADLAARCDTSDLAVSLIARHQEQLAPIDESKISLEDRLLCKLQAIDDNS